MIKFLATGPANRKILGLGLSHKNIEKLKLGQPIHFHAEQMGLGTGVIFDEVLIFVGETEESMRRDFEEKGYLEGAKVIEEQREKH